MACWKVARARVNTRREVARKCFMLVKEDFYKELVAGQTQG
jgi:hypothetical protein